MGIYENFKDKSDKEIIQFMEKIVNSGSGYSSGVEVLKAILDARIAASSSAQNKTMIKLTRAIYALTFIIVVTSILQFFKK